MSQYANCTNCGIVFEFDFIPITIIFANFLKEGKSSTDWKKAYVVPVHKKWDKQNYKPISILPICSKFF